MNGMTERAQWQAGTVIVQQELWRGKLWSARPMTVVEDRGTSLALWCPHGTRWKTATTPPTREPPLTRAERFAVSLTLGDWVLADFMWDVSTLVLVRPEQWHTVWVSWESPVRTGVGTSTSSVPSHEQRGPCRPWI